MEGIVGRRDNHSGFKIILPDEASDSGGSDHSREGHRCALFREPGGQDRGNVWARLTRVHADKHARSRMLAMQIGPQSVSGGKQRGIVERGSARNAANTVGTKK